MTNQAKKLSPHAPIKELLPGLWRVAGSMALPIERSMFVYRLGDRSLLLDSVVAMEEASMQALEALGRPSVMVVPHPKHTMDVVFYKQRYPDILAFSGFVTSFGAHIGATNLPSYAETVGVGAFMIGLVIAVYDFAELFAKPASGFLADRVGMKRTLLAGLVVFIVGSWSFLVLPPSLLLLTRFVQGLGAAALSTLSITLVAKYFATSRGRSFGIYNAVKGAGYVVAPTVGGLLVHARGFPALFIASAAVGILALVASFALPSDRKAGGDVDDDDDDLTFRQFLDIFRDRTLLPVYAVIVVNMFLVGILFGFLPLYLHGLGFSSLRTGGIVTVATASYLLVQPIAGYLADTGGTRVTVIGGMVLAATAIGVVTFITSTFLLVAVAIVAGAGVGTVWTNTDALVGALAKERRMGATMGAAQSFKELGDMIGPLAVGALTQLAGLRVGFVVCSVFALVLLGALSGSPAIRLDHRRE